MAFLYCFLIVSVSKPESDVLAWVINFTLSHLMLIPTNLSRIGLSFCVCSREAHVVMAFLSILATVDSGSFLTSYGFLNLQLPLFYVPWNRLRHFCWGLRFVLLHVFQHQNHQSTSLFSEQRGTERNWLPQIPEILCLHLSSELFCPSLLLSMLSVTNSDSQRSKWVVGVSR